MLTGALIIAVTLTQAGSTSPARSRAITIADAWRAMPAEGHACGKRLSFDYGPDGGMRNFFCRALKVFSWKSFLAMAPAPPFRAGPHTAGKLDLDSARDFGRYDPAFVRWAIGALVPAATDPALREETQPVYDTQVRALARVYFQVWRVVSAAPEWLATERTLYLEAMRTGGAGWAGELLSPYHDTLGDSDSDWGGNDPNHVRAATAFWVRRSIDETAPLWAEGLTRLLETYDRPFLERERRRIPRPPPVRPAPGLGD